jgi:RHS repeat-associated protein
VVERVSYDAYGVARHSFPGDTDGDGAFGSSDLAALNAATGSNTTPRPITDPAYNPDLDVNADGTIDGGDYTALGVNPWTTLFAPGMPAGRISSGGGGVGTPDNDVGYCGYVFNHETQDYHVRFRAYAPRWGRWLQRDPAGYAWAMSQVEYVKSSSVSQFDAMGLGPAFDVIRPSWTPGETSTSPATAEEVLSGQSVSGSKSQSGGGNCEEECVQMCAIINNRIRELDAGIAANSRAVQEIMSDGAVAPGCGSSNWRNVATIGARSSYAPKPKELKWEAQQYLNAVIAASGQMRDEKSALEGMLNSPACDEFRRQQYNSAQGMSSDPRLTVDLFACFGGAIGSSMRCAGAAAQGGASAVAAGGKLAAAARAKLTRLLQKNSSPWAGGFTETTLTQPLAVMRSYSLSRIASSGGRWWTVEMQMTSQQMREGLAILPEWNACDGLARAILPVGTKIRYGFAAKQGNLPGGCLQIELTSPLPSSVPISTSPLK